ncbi:lysylphosphatidylglycerol synthase domain-containing protein [Actinosynnema sp. NPDC020468]|uniref:lysylphosphatidylglycerol synthase domain-containing protein n=1 Tax=Actinosynnema sp. NPDC020468 TaxID=3154488 RepID=UPI0033E95386
MTVQPDVDVETVAEKAPRTRKQVIIGWARRLLIVLVLAGAVYQVYSQWDEVSEALLKLPWQSVVLSLLAVFAGLFLGSVVWKIVLSDLGAPVSYPDAAKFYLVGGLGKYIPGAVWAVLLSMELAKQAGVNRARSFTAGLVATGMGVVASLITGLAALPVLLEGQSRQLLWLFSLLLVGLVFLHPKLLTWLVNLVLKVLRKPPLERRFTGKEVLKATGVAVLIYVLYGVHLWLLVNSLGSPSIGTLVLCAGTMGISMTAGLLAFFLPSGLGARELVITGAIATVLPTPQVLALALVSRLMFTVADLASAGIAALVAQFQRKKTVAVEEV